jgi:ABC-type branched-subunit amino acid transport system substrate-binding protein
MTNFDIDRADGRLKDEAAQSLKENDTNAAKGYWQLAIREDETDAEACIYQENQNVLDSSNDYVTLVVVVTLTGQDKNAINVGRSILQGACVAQKEYNSQHKLPNSLLVRLLIANVGDPSIYADSVAKQIKEAATNDTTTIVGVVGQLSNSDDAILELNKAGIPMISSTALYSTGETSYLFSVAPSIQREAEVAAQAATRLSRHVVLLYDPDNTYSNSLAQAFKSQFATDGGTIVENTYTTGQATNTLPGRIDAAMSSMPTPGLIYLAGYPDDASFLVPYVHSRWPGVQVMGGDALYQYVHSYISLEERAAFNSLLFTSFAFHDEWKGHIAQEPVFFSEYAQDFDSQKQHAGNPYGYLLPDSDTILSYDATNVFLKACSNILTKEKDSLTPKTLWQALQNTSPFSGVSGQIFFGNDGEPLEKAVVIMQVKPTGTDLMEIQGRYP